MPELAEPDEGLGVVHLLLDELGHHVSGVDVDGADGHDLLPVSRGQVAQEVGDQGVQLGHLGTTPRLNQGFNYVALEGCPPIVIKYPTIGSKCIYCNPLFSEIR